MSARRLLLIDSDDDFHRILDEQVAPYGFEIHRVAEHIDALKNVAQVGPELIFIAVEEPDKLGYSLCSKAKKGQNKGIPVILTTASVPPSGFNSHRRLSVHADDYIDKRTMSAQELVDKIDKLVHLSGPSQIYEVEDLGIDVESFEEAEETRIAPTGVMMEAASGEDTADGDYDDLGSSPFTSALPDLRDDTPGGSFLGEDNVKTSASAPFLPADQAATVIAPLEDAGDSGAEQAPPASPSPPAGNIDREIDQVVEMASEEQSGRHDRRAANRLQTLERENQRLRAELDKVRQSSDSGASSFSRERELLNLREIINQKEKEILELRDEVGGKDRQILDGKEEIRQLQRTKTELDSKNLELEQRILEHTEQIASLEADKQGGLERIRTLDDQIAELDQNLAQTITRGKRDLKSLEQAHAQALEEQKKAGDEAREAALAQQKSEYEARLAKLRQDSERELQAEQEAQAQRVATARGEAQADKERALAAARDQYEGEKQAAREAHATELAELRANHNQAITELENRASEELAETEASYQRAMEQAAVAAEERRQADLARAREEHGAETAALERGHAKVVQNLEQEKQQLQTGLDSARSDIERLKGELESACQTIEERDQTIAEHLATIAQQGERIAAFEADVSELESQNTGYQDQILKAYKKIKSDEATVSKAKRALAVALTLLDDSITDVVASDEDAS